MVSHESNLATHTVALGKDADLDRGRWNFRFVSAPEIRIRRRLPFALEEPCLAIRLWASLIGRKRRRRFADRRHVEHAGVPVNQIGPAAAPIQGLLAALDVQGAKQGKLNSVEFAGQRRVSDDAFEIVRHAAGSPSLVLDDSRRLFVLRPDVLANQHRYSVEHAARHRLKPAERPIRLAAGRFELARGYEIIEKGDDDIGILVHGPIVER